MPVMGLTKQYLRYVASAVFGVIGSQKANIAYVTLRGGEKGRYVAWLHVNKCHLGRRKGEKVLILQGQKHEVTFLCASPDGIHLAVGYEDGAVRIFSLLNGESNVSFNGHKTAVSAMHYDSLGARLVTGSRDTDVIVWDIINECGLYRLRGHKDVITEALFLKDKNILVTSSKDSFVKWWDLDTQHCFKTMVGHRSEVWGMVLLNQENRLLTGSADSELRAWDIDYLQERILSCKKAGSILREARDRVVSLTADAKARVIACHGNDLVLEIFTVLSEEEVQKKMTKKTKKAKKKATKAQGEAAEEEPAEEPLVERTLKDEILRLTNIKASAKIRWVDCLSCVGGELKVALLLQNNTVETYSLKTSDKTPTANKTSRLTLADTAPTSDNLAVLSASGDTVKVWNRSTLQVIRTMACEYALCSLFVPGDRQIILGTKSGKLQIFELASGSLLETVDAHSGALWSLCLAPDQRGIVTGSADKKVKFWEFELIKDEGSGSGQKRLTLNHTRTLQLEEDILCVKFSPDNRLLAVSLLDCTVKVFYTDTLKFFLSLYGHKLPVLCLDISHRHVPPVSPKTHLFFTAGKDKKIKQWDADKFQLVQTLEGHHREVWCLTISPNGDHIVSASHDKSLRLWERTREPIILEEEREMAREAEFEEDMAKGDAPVVPGETEGEAAPAGKKTVETVKAAERIMEALEIYREESRKMEEHKYACQNAANKIPPPKPNPILVAFGNVSPSQYVLDVIKKVRSSELEVSLLVLPFPYVPELLRLFNSYIHQGLEVELVCRCLFFLLKIHFGQISSNQMMLSVIDELRTNTVTKVREIRDVMGFNSAALQFLQREIESKEDVMFFADATGQLEEKKRKRRRRERAILTIA
ncbi:hypothetical protein F7725_002343 [Dissostichus mawsoni]|uniref:Small-subunit processome Utp12 domain-containing protein n=1 Tax=Dissostichus mawsoni TaxID=36200 RepID=A0A7J5Y239_DISMA|nr:hypothetical protein F7725_002343 [Dissostichus mawsoni]